jgi:hypothetical protein
MNQRKRPLWLAVALICLNLDCGNRPTLSSSAERPGRPESRGGGIMAETSPTATAVDGAGASDAVATATTAARRPASNRPLLISFDTLQPDRYAQPVTGQFPRQIEDLRGKRVRIRGYMLPAFQQTGILEFVLVRDNMQCCFGAIVNPFDCVVIHMDHAIDYEIDPVTVEGDFGIEDESSDSPVFYSIWSAKESVTN